jgi:hypothetical protein
MSAAVQLLGGLRQRLVFHDHIQGKDDDLPFGGILHQAKAVGG